MFIFFIFSNNNKCLLANNVKFLCESFLSLSTITIHFFLSFQYHTEGNRAQFYIDDSSTAYALAKVSRKITDKDGYKVQCYKMHMQSSG